MDKLKRLKSVIIGSAVAASAIVLPLASATPSLSANAADGDNYAKLLQYSLYFYDANMCGDNSDCALSWRGNCHTNDEVPGGFHDAGDHVMFGQPQGYTAATLGWAYYEFKDAFDATGQTAHLKVITDKFAKFFRDATVLNGNTVQKVLIEKGEGGADHSYWGAPETQGDRGRMLWSTGGAANVTAEYAAALAANYVNFGNTEDLKYAKALYDFSKQNPATYSCEFYGSGESGSKDELAWAAGWLYLATKDESYLNDLKNGPLGYWVMNWENVSLGAGVLLGSITGDWSHAPELGNLSGDGYKFYDKWGSARHNATAQMCSLIAAKHGKGDASWAKGQMQYLTGDKAFANGQSYCLVCGFKPNASKNPHHRAASGTNSAAESNDGVQNKYTLIGALCGGPTDANGTYRDVRSDYVSNEVACDYNAGFVGAAAGLYSTYKTGSTESSIEGVTKVYGGGSSSTSNNNQPQNNDWNSQNNNQNNNQNNDWNNQQQNNDWNNQNQNNDWNSWNNQGQQAWDWNNQNNNQWNGIVNNEWNNNNWDWNNQNNDWNNQNNNWNQNNDWNNQNQNNDWNNQQQNNDWNNQNQNNDWNNWNNQGQQQTWDWNNQNNNQWNGVVNNEWNNNNWDWNNQNQNNDSNNQNNNWNQNNDWNNQNNNQWNGVANNDWNNQQQNNNWNQNNDWNNQNQGNNNNSSTGSFNSSATMADDFRTGSSRYFIASDGWTNGDPFDCGWYKSQTAFRNGALELTIDRDNTGKYRYAGAEYRTNDFYGFGYYETSMQAIKNTGVNSSFFTYTGPSDNNPWDEIDVEILGKDTTKVQFNYYTNGQGNHEKMYDLGFDASQGFHTFGFDWQRDHITWYVDGKAVYTAYDNIPQTPGKIMMNAWPGTGVDEWLGHYDGKTPLTARYQWVTYKNSGSSDNNNNNWNNNQQQNNDQNQWNNNQQQNNDWNQWNNNQQQNNDWNQWNNNQQQNNDWNQWNNNQQQNNDWNQWNNNQQQNNDWNQWNNNQQQNNDWNNWNNNQQQNNDWNQWNNNNNNWWNGWN